jgi:hypothetical protein
MIVEACAMAIAMHVAPEGVAPFGFVRLSLHGVSGWPVFSFFQIFNLFLEPDLL